MSQSTSRSCSTRSWSSMKTPFLPHPTFCCGRTVHASPPILLRVLYPRYYPIPYRATCYWTYSNLPPLTYSPRRAQSAFPNHTQQFAYTSIHNNTNTTHHFQCMSRQHSPLPFRCILQPIFVSFVYKFMIHSTHDPRSTTLLEYTKLFVSLFSHQRSILYDKALSQQKHPLPKKQCMDVPTGFFVVYTSPFPQPLPFCFSFFTHPFFTTH